MRVLFYSQQLSGIGHFIRIFEIAKQMSARHQVWMIDGGRPVPRSDFSRVTMVSVPRLRRAEGMLAPLESEQSVDQLMTTRRMRLQEALASIKPDALVIEHYPFSKWALGDEIDHLLNFAREANPAVKIICSVREIPLQTRHEDCSAEAYVEQVLQRLHCQFDGLMVHGDPQLTTLAMYFPGADQIKLPITYTGIVAEHLTDRPPVQIIPGVTDDDQLVIASAGGGADAIGLLRLVQNAWRGLRDKRKLADHKLLLFSGLDTTGVAASPSSAKGYGIFHIPFSTDYFGWMQRCRLSISCAGYNTCANLLASACRSILVPNTMMSDQAPRANLLKQIGLTSMDSTNICEENIADAMIATLAQPKPHYSIDLNGASASEKFIEGCVGGKF